MKFSTRTTYGVRAMIALAKNYGQGSLSLRNIAREEKISRGYLERLFARLKKSELVKAVKGKDGGYTLAKAPGKINMFEIIRSLEGNLSPFHCIEENGKIYCSRECRCGATKVLVDVQKAINNTLKGITLKDLV
ncbi:Rrf2 family transcriptional regulator [Candidatus Parcubacteria bacterium]|nr:Rrf2 family transcriptional regulator [Candidatus Parcubacteria bacterium]